MHSIYQKPNTNLQTAWPKSDKIKTEPLSLSVETANSQIKTKLRKYAKATFSFIAAYCEDSNIHGPKYVVKGGLTTIEHGLWLLLVIASMYFCVEIGLQSVDRYYTKSTVVGLERNFYYWNTTVPSSTVCPLYRLDPKLFNEYSRLHNLSAEDSKEFFMFMEKLANSTYSNFLDIPNNKSIDLILDRLNIKPKTYMQLIYNLTGDRSLKYKADLKSKDDKIYGISGEFIIEARQILTEYGLCYMANTLLSEKFSSSYMIWGEYPANEIRELPFLLRVRESSYFESYVSYIFLGFKDSPIDGFFHGSHEVMQLDHNLGYTTVSTQIDIDCIQIVAEEGLESSTTVRQRKCRFHHENNLTHYPIYTRNLCLQECRLNLVYQICKCIPHFYPNHIKNPKTVCNYKMLRECLAQYENLFTKLYTVNDDGNKKIVPCYCEQNCQDSIVNKRSTFILQRSNALFGGNSFLLSIANLPTYRLKRLMIFSFTDLLVSIGGTAGLFLGFSVLCLVEFIYYFTLRLLFYITD